MAKSLRSKSKRAFRSKKREESIYAATAAARLQRLNSKLLQVMKREKEGEVNDTEEDQLGWCWFATFGLLDPNDITLDGLESIASGSLAYAQQRGSSGGIWSDYEESFWFFFSTISAIGDEKSDTISSQPQQNSMIHCRINQVRRRVVGLFIFWFNSLCRLHGRRHARQGVNTWATRF